ncbi:hypothetical protein RhiirA4_507250 [Rhizophagus irregularis]|uniref:Uncharacterized protein n=1 Tax=Rhizophagus irregularis TaxID=588596 RepID=A0A2I1HC55_9GLOM|nr:hypothetical protein RhiirA4_507250 [Rhizophagus irregularis]
MSNNIKDKKVRNNTVSLLFSDNDNIKISATLSFIRNKLQGRLKNISVINDRTAVIIYGKHKDRLMIDLKDNNYYEDLEEKLEALKAENDNLLEGDPTWPAITFKKQPFMKKVRDKVIEGIEVVEINVENKNEVDDDVEIMEIDVENEDIQNGNIKSRTEEKVKKNFKAKELKKKFKKFGEEL